MNKNLSRAKYKHRNVILIRHKPRHVGVGRKPKIQDSEINAAFLAVVSDHTAASAFFASN